MREANTGMKGRDMEGNWMSFKGQAIRGLMGHVRNLVLTLNTVNYH